MFKFIEEKISSIIFMCTVTCYSIVHIQCLPCRLHCNPYTHERATHNNASADSETVSMDLKSALKKKLHSKGFQKSYGLV